MTSAHTLIAGRYLLQELLGRGGMGRVWRGVDERLNRTVALKELVSVDGLGPGDMAELRRRALREARAAARLNHPHAVRVYDTVVADGVAWIVMEYVPSRSLFQIVTANGPIPPERAARYGLDVLSALTAAHRIGLLHRDVKPGNVLIGDDGRVVLTDFGLAMFVDDPSITRSGVVIGSPSYMAPERAADSTVGPPADLWSLGATLYFAVEGRSPYERGSVLATLAALASEDPRRSERSGPLWPVLAGLLRRDPATRLTAPAAQRALLAVTADRERNSPRTPARKPTAAVRSASAPPARAVPAPPAGAVPAPAARAVPAPAAGAASTVEAVPSRSRRRLLLAGVAVAIAAVIVWAVRPEPDRPSTPTVVASAAATQTPPPAGAIGTVAPPSAEAEVLPPGWHLYVDPTGFTVAVPQSWVISRRGSIVYFDEPNGDRLLGIDQTDRPQPDPVADWRAKEQYRVARGDFPDYHRVRLVAVDYFISAADWEFTYVRSGVRLHVNNRGFITSPQQAYGMWWSTADSNWNRYLPDLQRIQRSFRPAA